MCILLMIHVDIECVKYTCVYMFMVGRFKLSEGFSVVATLLFAIKSHQNTIYKQVHACATIHLLYEIARSVKFQTCFVMTKIIAIFLSTKVHYIVLVWCSTATCMLNSHIAGWLVFFTAFVIYVLILLTHSLLDSICSQ